MVKQLTGPRLEGKTADAFSKSLDQSKGALLLRTSIWLGDKTRDSIVHSEPELFSGNLETATDTLDLFGRAYRIVIV